MTERVATRRAVPDSLRKRGITGAVEVSPHRDFLIKNAGQQLAHLFRDELQQRLLKVATTKKGAVNA